MAFRFKDLMISVVGEGAAGGQGRLECGVSGCSHCSVMVTCAFGTGCGISCGSGTHHGCGVGLTCAFGTGCGATCAYHTIVICNPTIFPCGPSPIPCGPSAIIATGDSTFRELPATDLQQLRAQLEKALAEVAEEERRQEAALRPRSRAEAEELEVKLKEALAELQRQKRELE
jgi:hypothetical protein